MKIVINNCYGGFSLSEKAYEYLGLEWDGYGYAFEYSRNIKKRSDEKLIKCVEELGEGVNRWSSDLVVVEIPDDVYYTLEEYDGIETVVYSKSEIHYVGGND